MAASMARIFLALTARSTTIGCRPPPVRHFGEDLWVRTIWPAAALADEALRKTLLSRPDDFFNSFGVVGCDPSVDDAGDVSPGKSVTRRGVVGMALEAG